MMGYYFPLFLAVLILTGEVCATDTLPGAASAIAKLALHTQKETRESLLHWKHFKHYLFACKSDDHYGLVI